MKEDSNAECAAERVTPPSRRRFAPAKRARCAF